MKRHNEIVWDFRTISDDTEWDDTPRMVAEHIASYYCMPSREADHWIDAAYMDVNPGWEGEFQKQVAELAPSVREGCECFTAHSGELTLDGYRVRAIHRAAQADS